jgi:hypothetical protein
MLHKGATTQFILHFLTRTIQVNFSIRQGDPLAMIIYIIYVEPLLLLIEKMTTGLRMGTMVQRVEAYCDDINLVSTDLQDLRKVDEAVKLFEGVSGALLSRGKKCKIMGLGKWEGKQDWP